MSSVGRFTAWRTIIIVTRPADGMPAAPIAAAVAVILAGKIIKGECREVSLTTEILGGLGMNSAPGII